MKGTRMRKHLACRSLVAGLIAILAVPVLGQPERVERDWSGIDALYPADATPGGAACGQRAKCYQKRWDNSIQKCKRCCGRACPSSNNCIRGCYPALVDPSRWP